MFPFFPVIPISIVISLTFSIITAFVASSKGRSALGWFCMSFIVGFLFSSFSSMIVLIIILIVPNLAEQRERLAKEGAWRRRHHESFEQERSVNSKFRDHVISRLDRQDGALGLPPMENRHIDPSQTPKEIVAYPVLGNGIWYLVINGQEAGPYKEQEVLSMLDEGRVNRDTYAWSEGMQDWQRAGTIGNFSSHC